VLDKLLEESGDAECLARTLLDNLGARRAHWVIAIGAGSIGWAHVTDSAFWVVKEYLNVSLSEALKKFTGGTVVASLVALLATLLLNYTLG